MNKKSVLELVWWLATGVILLLFLLPILTYVGDRYPFYLPNVILIIIFITFTRYIFLLKHTFVAHRRWLKLILIFLPIPLFFFTMDTLYNFQDFIDRGIHINMLSHLGPDLAMDIAKYIKYQYIFFGAGSIIVIFLLPVRMIVSIWRSINKGTV